MKTNITKKIILGAIITCGLFTTVNAQTAYDDQTYNNDQYSNSQPQQSQTQQYTQPQQYVQPQQYAQSAPVVNSQQSFYYYPTANVYFDINTNRYIYNNGYGWLSVNILPQGIFLDNAARYMVYHRGPQVWLDNPIHIRNYNRQIYRQPIVAYNNYRHDDFGRRLAMRNNFERNNRFDHYGRRR